MPDAPQQAELDRIPAALRGRVDRILISAAEIQAKVSELARRIDQDYAGEEILLIGVLKGAFVVIADLARSLTIPCSVDFMAVSSYGSATKTSGVVRILKDLDADIEGKHVIVVEDIIDSGLTLDYLVRNLNSRGPASLAVMALLTKPSRHRVEVPLSYLGFEIEDHFVVGYGLDLDQHHRNLPFICTLKGVD